jgi:hypothetical protein
MRLPAYKGMESLLLIRNSAALQEVPREFQKFRNIHRRIVKRLLFDIISIARRLVENANNSINPVFSYAQY